MDKDVKEAFQVLVNKLDDMLTHQKEFHDLESKTQAKSLIAIRKLFLEHGTSLAELKQAISDVPELQEIVKALA
jgi:hypothetical protein